MRDLVLAAINDGAFLLCVLFIGYVLLIIVPFVRRRRAVAGDGRAFLWHFIVPCLDEEAVIASTVRHLAGAFPGAHIWCVDDGSTDATPVVLANLAAAYSRVHIVTRRWPHARQGKGEALNAGWRALRRWRPLDVDPTDMIVGVVDADGRLDRRCLDMIAGPSFFGNPEVGAVQVAVRVTEPAGEHHGPLARLLVRMQDMEFAGVIAAMQNLRRHIGSVGMGGNGQFTRLSVLETITVRHGTPWHGALLEDFELGLHVLLVGSRTEYCHDTYVIQEGIPSLWGLVRQRSRWAQGSMQCARYFRAVLRSKHISNAGAFEIGYFLLLPWLQLLGGLFYAFSAGVLAWYVATTPGGPSAWFSSDGWGLLPLFLVFGLGPLVVWGPVYRAAANRRLSRSRAVALGMAAWPYSYVHHLATWLAFVRFLRSRNNWLKTERRTKPELAEGPIGPAVSAPTTAVELVEPSLSGAPGPRPLTVDRRTPTADDWETAVQQYRPTARTTSARSSAHGDRPRPAVRSGPSSPPGDRRALVARSIGSATPAHGRRGSRNHPRD